MKTSSTKQQWTWNWIKGGYNSCTASSREEALKIATDMGIPRWGGVTLAPDPSTLRAVSDSEMATIDRGWHCAFD